MPAASHPIRTAARWAHPDTYGDRFTEVGKLRVTAFVTTTRGQVPDLE
ncbi:hypothetical protein ACTWPB_05445 [Nocardia sp. IBHARD005]